LAGEALGAIGCTSVIDLLDEYTKDPVPEVSSCVTCPKQVGVVIRGLEFLKLSENRA